MADPNIQHKIARLRRELRRLERLAMTARAGRPPAWVVKARG